MNDMKIMKSIAVILLVAVMAIGINIGADTKADLNHHIRLACSLEALIMPPGHTFSPESEAQLLRWIDVTVDKLEHTRVRPFGFRGRINDVLERLDRCRIKLTKDSSSNTNLNPISGSSIKLPEKG